MDNVIVFNSKMTENLDKQKKGKNYVESVEQKNRYLIHFVGGKGSGIVE